MVGRKRRSGKRGPATLGSHQRSWIRGRNLLRETLAAGRWLPLEILIASDSASDYLALDELWQLASSLGLAIHRADTARLTQLCGARDHQGIIARMPPYPVADAARLLGSVSGRALFLLLDGLQDPFNFGAICRVACAYGVDGIFIPEHGQVPVNSQVARSSAGAVNYLQIAPVTSLASIAAELKSRGAAVVATMPQATTSLTEADFRGPTAIAIGNEGVGLSEELARQCDVEIRIPQTAEFESLNAAVAAGIVLYETHCQRYSPRRSASSE